MIKNFETFINESKIITEKTAKLAEKSLGIKLTFEEVLNAEEYSEYSPSYESFKDGINYDSYMINIANGYWGLLISHKTNNIGIISNDGDVVLIKNGKLELANNSSQNACYSLDEWKKTNLIEFLSNVN